MDYEYEYIYYYYDDDDDKSIDGSNNNKKISSQQQLSSSSSLSNKSRYTTLDRSGVTATPTTATTILPQMIGNHSRGRSSQISIIDEQPQQLTSEERLPINTRFPPRSSNNITPTIAVDDTKKQQLLGNGGSSVKRPSLELVDSHSFNRDDKGNKNGRTFENEFDKKLLSSSTTTTTTTVSPLTMISSLLTINDDSLMIDKNNNDDSDDSTTSSTDTTTTTPLMDKVAFDLYAISANANTDLTTINEIDNVDDTESSTMTLNDDIVDDSFPTTELPYTTTMTPTTTTTTTTTITTSAPRTTTTTTEQPSATVSGRKSPFGAAGRNRFRFRNNNVSQSTIDTSTDKQHVTTTELIHHKSNRFSRPKSGYSSSSSSNISAERTKYNKKDSSSKQIPIDNEQQSLVEQAPSVSTSTFKGRNRGRPNLRASTTTTTTESSLSSILSSSNKGSSSIRARPSFQLRSRNRPTSAAAVTIETISTLATILKSDTINDGSSIDNNEKLDTKSSTLILPTKPSR